jgi:predicted nucleic acid-binding protein
MNLVCNAGPIIALAKINQLPLLEQLGFSSVAIPQTVFYELLAKPGIETVRILEVAQTFS